MVEWRKPPSLLSLLIIQSVSARSSRARAPASVRVPFRPLSLGFNSLRVAFRPRPPRARACCILCSWIGPNDITDVFVGTHAHKERTFRVQVQVQATTVGWLYTYCSALRGFYTRLSGFLSLSTQRSPCAPGMSDPSSSPRVGRGRRGEAVSVRPPAMGLACANFFKSKSTGWPR
ncbi:hypothetical protein BC628DRAFT_1404398 [Trametes gibbosa]|nr:hypothetical protein BC628DRAFT_1404398 [Trametes gibbosa]